MKRFIHKYLCCICYSITSLNFIINYIIGKGIIPQYLYFAIIALLLDIISFVRIKRKGKMPENGCATNI